MRVRLTRMQTTSFAAQRKTGAVTSLTVSARAHPQRPQPPPANLHAPVPQLHSTLRVPLVWPLCVREAAAVVLHARYLRASLRRPRQCPPPSPPPPPLYAARANSPRRRQYEPIPPPRACADRPDATSADNTPFTAPPRSKSQISAPHRTVHLACIARTRAYTATTCP